MAGTVLGSNKGDSGAASSVTLEQVMVEVNKTIDSKLGARFEDFKKTGLSEAIASHVKPVNEQLTTINEALNKLVSNPGTTPIGDGTNRGGGNMIPPELNAQLRTLNDTVKNQGKTIADLQAAKESAEKRAEETERHSTIRTALNGLPFVNDRASETAFSIVLPHVKRMDDNTLVASINGENFPVPAFAKDFLEKEHAYLFKASGVSGSGAPNTGSGVRMGAKIDINSIKPGMKLDDRAAAVEAISAVMASNQ